MCRRPTAFTLEVENLNTQTSHIDCPSWIRHLRNHSSNCTHRHDSRLPSIGSCNQPLGSEGIIAAIAAVNAPIIKPSKHLSKAVASVLTDPGFKKSFWNREYKIRAEERNRRQQGSNSSGGSNGKTSRFSRLDTVLRKPGSIELIEHSCSKNSNATKTDTTWWSKSQKTTARTTRARNV